MTFRIQLSRIMSLGTRTAPHAHIVAIPGGTHLIVATHSWEIGRAVAQFIKETSANDTYFT